MKIILIYFLIVFFINCIKKSWLQSYKLIQELELTYPKTFNTVSNYLKPYQQTQRQDEYKIQKNLNLISDIDVKEKIVYILKQVSIEQWPEPIQCAIFIEICGHLPDQYLINSIKEINIKELSKNELQDHKQQKVKYLEMIEKINQFQRMKNQIDVQSIDLIRNLIQAYNLFDDISVQLLQKKQ